MNLLSPLGHFTFLHYPVSSGVPRSLAALSSSQVTLTCPPVLGDYVLLYWVPSDAKQKMLIFQFDRWRRSYTNQTKPRLHLIDPASLAAAGNFSFLLSPAPKDGGLYTCKVFLDDKAFSQANRLSVLHGYTKSSLTTRELSCLYSERCQVEAVKWSYVQDPRRSLQSFNVMCRTTTSVVLPVTNETAGQYACTLYLKNGKSVQYMFTVTMASIGVEQSPSHHSGEAENIYENPDDLRQGWNYQPRGLERHTDSILGWASVLWSLSYYSSPLLLCYLYRKGYICSSKLAPLSQYVGTALVCLIGVACLRGWGRWRNPEYVQFISILEETRRDHTPNNKKKLACFDFDFKHWPVDFSWKEVSSPKLSKGGVSLLRPEPKHRGAADSVLNSVRTLPCHILSYLIVHSFGRRMLYPGSLGLLQKAMRPMLQQGQARLVEEYDGQRNKLVACDGNEIDTMFVDRRKDGGQAGKTLVICCEGNAGFYEVGCMNTPLDGGYSVLGWNHPGFGGSTGVPLPQNEANAMDVVIQFAVHKLGFQLSDIIVYAWSIGGFTASWAVMSYPEIRALVLDASFDDLLPLALKVMPDSWRPLVTRTVRQYMNLNNAEQLCKYQGPVLLIRRTKDEIITTTGPEDIMSNRGNDLLLKLLQYRSDTNHTNCFLWFCSGESVYTGYEVDDDWCLSVLQSYQTDRETLFPWSVGTCFKHSSHAHVQNFNWLV
ncbi:hypothetical protein cypCar_00012697 [Cyprinus carpio]|nr:hypothetical protein cypCar_00012697 [Cyprinus carpio]